jgi:small-conductance mechanosensitive channel
MNIARVLKNPGPKCLISEFGDSTVNLILRVWINDPQNGIANLKDAVLSEIWDNFHANGIEIAFPQRDLHIKDSVPLRIYRKEEKTEADSPPEGSPRRHRIRESRSRLAVRW